MARQAELTASLHFSLGLAFMETKRYESCVEHMRLCVAKRARPALSPINKEIRKAGPNHCLAVSLWRLERNQEARQVFTAAVSDDPQSPIARLDFARFLANQGDLLPALEQLTAAVGLNPKVEAPWILGAQVALANPEFLPFAHDWTSEAVKHLPDNLPLRRVRAEVLMLSDESLEALPLWQSKGAVTTVRALAALILCEITTGHGCDRRLSPADERQVSQEFLQWFRRLTASGAAPTITALQARIDELELRLPSAAGLLRPILEEAAAAVPA